MHVHVCTYLLFVIIQTWVSYFEREALSRKLYLVDLILSTSQ